MVVLDRASSMGIAGSSFPWTWVLDTASIAEEAAGSGQDMNIDSLDSTAAAAEDEEKKGREGYAQVGH